jgi:small subunit ribosomal protein S6
MNIECDKKTLDELTGAFRFSDAVIRHLVVAVPAAVTEASPMAREEEGGRSEDPGSSDRDPADEPASAAG